MRLSTEKTVLTPLSQGCDCLGQTLRKHERRNRKPAKLRITPSTARFQARTAKVRTRGKQAAGATPEQLIEALNPLLRGWANYHRQVLWGQSFAQLDSFGWRRRYGWATRRHPDKTGHWITERYFPQRTGEAWRFTDPTTGKQIIHGQEVVKPQRSLKVKGEANPFDPAWEVYFQHRDRELALRASSPFRATLLNQQHGFCPGCRQVIQVEEEVDLHHRDGNHQHNHWGNRCSYLPLAIGRNIMHQSLHLHPRVPHGALVRLERSAAKVARCVLRGL